MNQGTFGVPALLVLQPKIPGHGGTLTEATLLAGGRGWGGITPAGVGWGVGVCVAWLLWGGLGLCHVPPRVPGGPNHQSPHQRKKGEPRMKIHPLFCFGDLFLVCHPCSNCCLWGVLSDEPS